MVSFVIMIQIQVKWQLIVGLKSAQVGGFTLMVKAEAKSKSNHFQAIETETEVSVFMA